MATLFTDLVLGCTVTCYACEYSFDRYPAGYEPRDPAPVWDDPSKISMVFDCPRCRSTRLTAIFPTP